MRDAILGLVIATLGTAAVGSGLLSEAGSASAATPRTVRVSTQPVAVVGYSGRSWLPDRFFSGGRRVTTAARISGARADNQALFRSARVGLSAYHIPIGAPGEYSVRLRMAEIRDRAPGRRVFDVLAEGGERVSRIDVARAVGRNAAYRRQFTVNVRDGVLDIRFRAIIGKPIVGAISVLPRRASSVPSTLDAAPPLWSGTYEGGGLTQFQNASWNYLPDAPTVGTAPVRSGKFAARYTIPAGGARCETVPLLRSLREGDDLYFAVSTYLEPGFPMNTGWQVLTQWKNDGSGSPPLELTVKENSNVFRVGGGYGHPSGPRLSGQDVGPVVTGQWIDWVFHITFSSDPTLGAVTVWRNGTQVMSNFHPTGGTLYPGLSSYLKNGYYRSSAITTDGHVWQDDLKVGTSYSSVTS